MAIHGRWSSGDLIFYDGTQDILTIKDDTDGVIFGESGAGVPVQTYGKMAFGVADWGVGATAVDLDGTDPDQVFQVHAAINTADVAQGAYAAQYNSMSITEDQDEDVSAFGLWSEFYLTASDLTGASHFAAVWGNVDATGTSVTSTGNLFGLWGVVNGASGLTNNGYISGCSVDSELHASMTNNGTIAAFLAQVGSGKLAWPYGVYIASCSRAWYSSSVMTGSTALNSMQIDVTDETTNASEYSRGLYVNVTSTGDKTSTGEVNAIGIDLAPTGDAYIATLAALYTAACGDAEIDNLWGIYMYMDDIGGSATVTTKYGMSIGIDNGDNATTCGYLRFYNHGSAGTDVDYVIDMPNAGITAAQYFFHAGCTGDMIETGDITSGKSCTHGLRVIIGSTPVVIPLYAD